MAPRVQIRKAFAPSPEFFPSGCSLLDLALGGGWGKGRVINIVGDTSSGKTLLAIEASAQFCRLWPEARVCYIDAEAAFDRSYAEGLGLPSSVDLVQDIDTLEGFFARLEAFLADSSGPSLFILDSIDALTTEAEQSREVGKEGYGISKAKQLSLLFRRQIRTISEKNCTLILISQVRDRIGVLFGDTKTKSGGHALDFFSSQIVWLSEVGKIERTIKGQKRKVGIRVRARVKKNKLGPPFREAEFQLLFGYGVDDELSMLDWLEDYKILSQEELAAYAKRLKEARTKKDRAEAGRIREELLSLVKKTWADIEEAIAPPMRKYDSGT